jgi:hypothetical protein
MFEEVVSIYFTAVGEWVLQRLRVVSAVPLHSRQHEIKISSSRIAADPNDRSV